jgi:hypothetical protein
MSRAKRRRIRSLFLVGVIAAGSSCALSACASCGADRQGFQPEQDATEERDAAPPSPSFEGGAGEGGACQRAAMTHDPLGCEYFVFGMGNDPPIVFEASCTVLFVSNPGDAPAHLRLTWRAAPVDLSSSARLVAGQGRTPGYTALVGDELPPGASAVIALIEGAVGSPIFHCPFQAAVTERTAAAGEGQPPADTFRLLASEPVSATYFWPYGGYYETEGAAAATLRSAESWSADYIDVGTFKPGRPPSELPYPTPSFTGLLAREQTRITLAGDGGPFTITLEGGTALLSPRDDLFIGTKVSADHPFGLFTGSESLDAPFGIRPDNQVLHSVSPPAAWASEYAAVKFPDRLEPDPAFWRFVAKADGTILTYEPATPPGAPTTINAGELVVFSGTGSFVVRSQDDSHPFHVSQMMPSAFTNCELDDAGFIRSGGNCQSVYPQLLTVPPVAEFAQRVAFLTEPYFPDTSLVVTRHADEDGTFRDVSLDCAGVLTGWHAVGLGDRYQTTRVALSNEAFEPQPYAAGLCDNGAHAMRSDGLFTVAVWAGQHTAVPPPDVKDRIAFASNYAFNVYGRRAERDAGPTK